MCFSTPEVKEPPMPALEDPEEAKGAAMKRNKGRAGYASTILAGDLQGPAPTEKKRLLGE